jgi:signal transduction histidine kinase
VQEPRVQESGVTRDLVIATVAHDLRNPLSAVYVALDLVLESLLTKDDTHRMVRRQLGIARHAAAHMLDLVTDLLDGTTMDDGRLALRVQPCDAYDIVHAVLDELEPLATKRDITLSRALAPELPPLLADRPRIARVFSNLVANAIRFTPPGGRITITATVDGDAIRFTVADTGIGIAQQDVPHVFDRFWRAESTSGSGTGLGLAIAKWIVEAHHGHITVESKPGIGSRFSFTILTALDARDAHAVGERASRT